VCGHTAAHFTCLSRAEGLPHLNILAAPILHRRNTPSRLNTATRALSTTMLGQYDRPCRRDLTDHGKWSGKVSQMHSDVAHPDANRDGSGDVQEGVCLRVVALAGYVVHCAQHTPCMCCGWLRQDVNTDAGDLNQQERRSHTLVDPASNANASHRWCTRAFTSLRLFVTTCRCTLLAVRGIHRIQRPGNVSLCCSLIQPLLHLRMLLGC